MVDKDKWQVIGRDGELYLIKVDENTGRVFNEIEGVVNAPFNIHSLISKGAWEEHELSAADTAKLIKGAKII
jgi:hypothetical protein